MPEQPGTQRAPEHLGSGGRCSTVRSDGRCRRRCRVASTGPRAVRPVRTTGSHSGSTCCPRRTCRGPCRSIRATAEQPFEAWVRRWWIDDLALVDCECSPCSGTRQRRQMADTDGEFVVVLMTRAGSETVSQGDVETAMRPGRRGGVGQHEVRPVQRVGAVVQAEPAHSAGRARRGQGAGLDQDRGEPRRRRPGDPVAESPISTPSAHRCPCSARRPSRRPATPRWSC